MGGDRLLIGVRAPGVYLITVTGAEPTEGLLVDRTHADPSWLPLADVVVASTPAEDPAPLIRAAAVRYFLRVTGPARVSPAPDRPGPDRPGPPAGSA